MFGEDADVQAAKSCGGGGGGTADQKEEEDSCLGEHTIALNSIISTCCIDDVSKKAMHWLARVVMIRHLPRSGCGKKALYFRPVTKYRLGDKRNDSITLDCHWFRPVLTDPSVTHNTALVYTPSAPDKSSVYPITMNEVLNVVQLTVDPVHSSHFHLAEDDLKIILKSMKAVVLDDTPNLDDTPAGGGGGGSGSDPTLLPMSGCAGKRAASGGGGGGKKGKAGKK